jgi:transposase
MSPKELTRLEIIQRLLRKEYSNPHAAELLELSVRQVKRLKKRVRRFGAPGLVHASRGRPSNRRLPPKERDTIATLLKNDYPDFKPTFASEKLETQHHIDRDPKTIRSIMIQEHLWTPKKQRAISEHRDWRQRRGSYGEME